MSWDAWGRDAVETSPEMVGNDVMRRAINLQHCLHWATLLFIFSSPTLNPRRLVHCGMSRDSLTELLKI